jgi:hypothetical protein
VTGNQEHLNEGNLKAEKGEWKSNAAEGTVPLPSWERVQGKVESCVFFFCFFLFSRRKLIRRERICAVQSGRDGYG